MKFFLIIKACLLNDPNVCQEFKTAYEGTKPNDFECMMNAQFEIVKFKETHNSWQFKKSYCTDIIEQGL